MPASTSVLGVEWVVKLDKFKAEMATVGGIGTKEGKALTAAFAKEMKATEKAAIASAKAIKDAAASASKGASEAGKGMSDLGDEATISGNKALKALGPLGGVLSKISPEAGSAAASIAGLTSAFEGFAGAGIAMGAVAALAVPLGVAIGSLVGVMDDYTASTKEATRAKQGFAAAMQPLNEAIAAAREEQERLNSALESGSTKKYLAIADLSAAADAKQADATKDLVAEKDRLMQTLAESANMDNFEGLQAQDRIKQIDREIGAVHKKADELARLSVTNYTLRQHIDEVAKAEGESAKAVDTSTEGLKLLNDEMARQAAQADSNLKIYDDVISKMQALEDADERAGQSKQGQLDLDHAANLQVLADLKAQADAVGTTVGARETAEQAYRAASLAENEAYYAACRDLDIDLTKTAQDNADKKLKAEQDYQAKVLQGASKVATQAADSIGSIAGTMESVYTDTAASLQRQLEDGDKSLTKSQKAELKERIEAQQDGAIAAFRTGQAAAIASATVSTAVAVVEAYKAGLSVGGPVGLVLGPAMAITAGAAGATQIAAIASEPPPSFNDTPSVQKMGDGGLVHLAKDDYFAAAKDPNELARQVGGSTGQMIVVQNIHRHKIFDVQVQQNLKAGGKLAGLQAAGRQWRRG